MATRRSTDARDAYVDAFPAFVAALNGGAAGVLQAKRREAIALLAEVGLPTARDEAWRHTNPAPLTRPFYAPVGEPAPVAAGALAPFVAAGVDGPLLVFVDGRFAPSLSRPGAPAGVRLASLARASADGDPELAAHLAAHTLSGDRAFAALSTAFVRDGALVVVSAGVALESPVQILHLRSAAAAGRLTAPRALVVAGPGSRLCLVETFADLAGGADGLTASLCEVVVGPGAEVEYLRLLLDGAGAGHAGTVHVEQGRAARFTAHTFCLSGATVRQDLTTHLSGEEIDSTLNGLFLPRGTEHVDNYTTIEHAAPNCSSHELYKGVLAGQAHGVFRGKIHVHRIAQKTDAYQSNKNLLLSGDAEIVSKPQLEIYADDVKCSHGSTTGQLDAAALFYLRSRGLGLAQARRVLTVAFARELVDRVRHDGLRAHVDGLVSARLDAVLAEGSTP